MHLRYFTGYSQVRSSLFNYRLVSGEIGGRNPKWIQIWSVEQLHPFSQQKLVLQYLLGFKSYLQRFHLSWLLQASRKLSGWASSKTNASSIRRCKNTCKFWEFKLQLFLMYNSRNLICSTEHSHLRVQNLVLFASVNSHTLAISSSIFSFVQTSTASWIVVDFCCNVATRENIWLSS